MHKLPQSVYPELCEFGATRVLQGTLDEASYAVGGLTLATPQGITYDLLLTNTGEAILLQGGVTAHCETECSRCLRPAMLTVEGEAQGYYLLQPGAGADGFDDDEFEVVDAQGGFDVGEALMAALVSATPVAVLCDEDCKGLCPRCGADLNEGPCSCGNNDIDPLNPFAALAGMRFDAEDVARGQVAAEQAAGARQETVPQPDDGAAALEDDPAYQAALAEAVKAVFSEDENADCSFDEDEPDPYTAAAQRVRAQREQDAACD